MRAREICLPWDEPPLTLGIPGAKGRAEGTLEVARLPVIGELYRGCCMGDQFRR